MCLARLCHKHRLVQACIRRAAFPCSCATKPAEYARMFCAIADRIQAYIDVIAILETSPRATASIRHCWLGPSSFWRQGERHAAHRWTEAIRAVTEPRLRPFHLSLCEQDDRGDIGVAALLSI